MLPETATCIGGCDIASHCTDVVADDLGGNQRDRAATDDVLVLETGTLAAAS